MLRNPSPRSTIGDMAGIENAGLPKFRRELRALAEDGAGDGGEPVPFTPLHEDLPNGQRRRKSFDEWLGENPHAE